MKRIIVKQKNRCNLILTLGTILTCQTSLISANELSYNEIQSPSNEIQSPSSTAAPILSSDKGILLAQQLDPSTLETSPSVTSMPSPPAPSEKPFKRHGSIEIDGRYSAVSGNQPNWHGAGINGDLFTDPNNIWVWQVINEQRYGERGTYASIANHHEISKTLSTDLSIASSSGGAFFPKFEAYADIIKQNWPYKRLDTGLQAYHWGGKDNLNKSSVGANAKYHITEHLALQGIATIARGQSTTMSNLQGHSETIGLTHDKWTDLKKGSHDAFIRYTQGTDPSAFIGPNQVAINEPFKILSARWKYWVNKNWGINLQTDNINYRTYRVRGGLLGFFREY